MHDQQGAAHGTRQGCRRCLQVGVAALDTSSLKLALVQLVETSRSYSSTKYGSVLPRPALNYEQWQL